MRHLGVLPDARLGLVMRGTDREPLWGRAHFTAWQRS
jgi:hypothetical protein